MEEASARGIQTGTPGPLEVEVSKGVDFDRVDDPRVVAVTTEFGVLMMRSMGYDGAT
jgi:hypothetical protein